MISDDVKFVKYQVTGAKRFGHWILFKDYRAGRQNKGRKGRKDLITFFQASLGPLGDRWQYQRDDNNFYILKLNNERDVMMFLLKYQKA